MKTWRIPVSWIDGGLVAVEANTLDEAIDHLYKQYEHVRPTVKDMSYFVGSFEVGDKESIRADYNDNQPDDQPDTRPAHKPIPPHYRPEVTEFCPHCDSEIGVIWNPKEDGYQIHCPRCGTKIMLCSMCPMHDRCDWNCDPYEYEHCSMMDKYFKVEVVHTSRKTVFVKAADPEEAETKAYELCGSMDFDYDDENMGVTVDSDYTGYPYTDAEIIN